MFFIHVLKQEYMKNLFCILSLKHILTAKQFIQTLIKDETHQMRQPSRLADM